MKRLLQLFFLALLTGFLNARIMDIIRADDLGINLLIGTGSFFVAGVLIFYYTRPRSPERLLRTYIIFSLSWLLLDLSFRLVPGEWHGSVFSLPRLPCELAAIFFAYRCFSKEVIPVTVGFVTLALTLFACIRYLNPMAYNYTSYGITNASVQLPAPQDWHIMHNDTTLHNGYSKDKYVVLDFWSKSCGVCYKKFPLLDSLYRNYQGRANVEILSVLIGSADDEAGVKAKKKVSELYHFPVALGDTTAQRLFNILCFPTVIVVHNGTIIYKGPIEGVHQLLPR